MENSHYPARAGLAILVSVLAVNGSAAPAPAGTTGGNERTWSGTVSAVDVHNRALRADTWWLPKTFVIGTNCSITVMGKGKATVSDLHPNEKVNIKYRDVDGVLVADRVADESLRFEGTVLKVDPQQGSVTIGQGKLARTFAVTDNCKVVAVDGIEGSHFDLEPGDKAAVIYAVSGSSSIASRINKATLSYQGKLEAIDLPERIVKADDPLGERRFSVAADCRIVVAGKPGAQLKDLKLERDYTFTYEQVNGVNVAEQISEALEPGMTDSQASK